MNFLNTLQRGCIAMALAVTLLGSPGIASAQGLADLFMSPEQEKRIGAQEHVRILEQFGGEYDDAELAAYVSSIGQFLALTSGASGVQFHFTVLNTPVVNAFALPGGYVYVTRGLVALADDEAELAGVLAHEIGHVAARHGAKRHSKSVLANIGLMVLGAATESSAAVNIGQLGAAAIISGYSREDEYEADTLGVRYMSRAGFYPPAMSSFLRKLEAHHQLEATLEGRSADQDFGFFATHPRTADRVARAVQSAGAVPVTDPIVAKEIYFGKIDGIVYGDDPSQGVIKGRRFIHPTLGFEFTVPPGFTLLNGSSSVIAQGKDGAGLQFDMHRNSRGGNMTRYIREVWVPEAPLTKLEPITVNRMRAATALVRGIQDGRADARLVAIAFDSNTVYRFLFIIPSRNSPNLDVEYRRTAFSFKRVSRSEAGRIHANRLVIRTVRSGETVHDLARLMPQSDHALGQFLVLNGLNEQSRLRVGQLVKLVSE